jgi:AcrR family transcriptional regulator
MCTRQHGDQHRHEHAYDHEHEHEDEHQLQYRRRRRRRAAGPGRDESERPSSVGYDPQGTRTRILDAAVEEFAEHGSAGARVDRIAVKASANKEAIYRNYGSKRELLRRVLDEYLNVRDDLPCPDVDDPAAYPADLVRSHAADPSLVRLLAWEGLESGDAIDERSVTERQRHYDRKVEALEHAQREGRIDPGLDPRHLLLAFIGMANWMFVSPQSVRVVFGREIDDELVEAHARFLAECARRIVQTPAQAQTELQTQTSAPASTPAPEPSDPAAAAVPPSAGPAAPEIDVAP